MTWEEFLNVEPEKKIKTKFDDFEVPEYVKYVEKYLDGNTCWFFEEWYAKEEHRKMILFDKFGRKFSDSYLDKLEESMIENQEEVISEILTFDYQNYQTFLENFSKINKHFLTVLVKLFFQSEKNLIFKIEKGDQVILIEKNSFAKCIRNTLHDETCKHQFDTDFMLKNSETIYDENKIGILLNFFNYIFVSTKSDQNNLFWKMLIKKEGSDDYISGWFLKMNRSYFEAIKTLLEIKDIERAHILTESPKEIELKIRLIKNVEKIE